MWDTASENVKNRGGRVNRMNEKSLEGFLWKCVQRNFPKWAKKYLHWSFFFSKVRWYKFATLFKTRFRHKFFSSNLRNLQQQVFSEHHRRTASDYSSINSSAGEIGKRNYKLWYRKLKDTNFSQKCNFIIKRSPGKD